MQSMLANGCVRGTLYCPANPDQNADELWNWYIKNGYRVTGYAFTFPPIPSARPLIADCTISQPGQNSPVPANQNNYNWTQIQGGWTKQHKTSHLINGRPVGGNIVMLDGHVEWRKFRYPMLPRTDPSSGAPTFWW